MKRRVWLWVACLLVLGFGVTPSAAALYGNQNYGSCAYGSTCDAPLGSTSSTTQSNNASTTPATVATLPSGLEVSVNLRDGQLIPRSGYTIVVTPLNGRGATFQSVQFAINSAVGATATPDQTGTAHWRWLPQQLPGTHVDVTITSSNGQTLAEHFTVRLASAEGVAHTNAGASAADGGTTNTVKRFFRALPRPLVIAIPYLLFGLLAGNIGILLTQTLREWAELRAARKRWQAAVQLMKVRHTFAALASHYLRTPLTLIAGGLEELRLPEASIVRTATARLQKSVAELLGAAVRDLPSVQKPVRPYRQAMLWVPLLTAGVLAFTFDYLANHMAQLALGRITLFVQAAVFALLAALLYVAVRLLLLWRRDGSELRRLSERTEAEIAAHEAFVAKAYAALQADFATLKQGAAALPDGASKTFVLDGVMRLQTLLDKLAIATQLHGANGASQKRFELADQLHRAWEPLAATACTKELRPTFPDRLELRCPQPNLLTLVCRHILDNAVAYAPNGSDITVAAKRQKGWAEISFTDHGAGIAADALRWLRTPFVKSEGAETFNHAGMGFSLYLDRLIMAYFGGELLIASRPGRGTTVTLRLPIADTQAPERGMETSQMPWPSAANIAQAAPITDSDEVN